MPDFRADFSGQEGADAHVRDVDIDADSLHHTLGKGRTQAAAGNHGHDASEISNLADPLEPLSDHQLLNNRNATDAHPQYAKFSDIPPAVDVHGNLGGLTADDHTAYPTKTGGRASGTWAINITGNATDSNNLGGHPASQYPRAWTYDPGAGQLKTGDLLLY